MNVLILILFFCISKPISGLPLDYDPDAGLVNLDEGNTPEPLIDPPVIKMIKDIIN